MIAFNEFAITQIAEDFYRGDFVFRSQKAVSLVGHGDLCGKPTLQDYWQKVLIRCRMSLHGLHPGDFLPQPQRCALGRDALLQQVDVERHMVVVSIKSLILHCGR